MSDTPRTDEISRGYLSVPVEWAKTLERELAEARKQRDTLAEALKLCEKHLEKHGREKCDEESDETGWWLLCGVRTALTAVKGGDA
jgi:hypothetical protein